MISQGIVSLYWDFPIEWNETLTLSLILFSTGLLCIISAILLAIYLLKSDRFTSTSPQKAQPFPKRIGTESRLSRFKKKLKSLFKRGETDLDLALDEYHDLKLKEPPQFSLESTKDDQPPSD